jgi:hypothetical protein
MNDKLIKKWIKERDEVLEQRNVDYLIAFLEKWTKKGIYTQEMVDSFKSASSVVQLGSLCKMIVNCTNISSNTKKWARNILDDLGWQ